MPEAVDGRGGPFILPPGTGEPLGEIVISFPYADRQAQQQNHPVQAELRLLLVHGILHLLGDDHLDPAEEAAMTAKTNDLLGRL